MKEKFQPLDGVVPGVFSDRSRAEKALEELRAIGLAEDEMGVIVPDPAHHHLMTDPETETVKGLAKGVLVGGGIGALAGMALAALVVPGVGVVGVGGALLFGTHFGGLWGAISGAYLGLTTEIHHLEDIEKKYRIELQPGEILVVVVTDRDRAYEVCQIMQRNGARGIKERVATDATA
jgi:hypothetical protein